MKTTFVFLLLATAVAQQRDEARPKGVIYGIAIGQEGQPAKGIGLTASPVGVSDDRPYRDPVTAPAGRDEFYF